MARYLVPHYIEMEDKIVGPLTLPQFLYLLAGGILSYFYFSFFDRVLAWVLTIPTASLFLALAFLKIQDQSLLKMLGALFLYLQKPRERIWQKQNEAKIRLEDVHLKKEEPKIVGPTREEIKSELQRVATIIETKGWSEVTGREHGPGEEAFKKRVMSHKEIKPEISEKK